MPSEWCRVCAAEAQYGTAEEPHHDNLDENLSLNAMRSAYIHNGRGCRFGQCQKHCNCPSSARKEWRQALADYNIPNVRCVNCNALTRHVCLQDSGRGIGAHRVRCAMCCYKCKHVSRLENPTERDVCTSTATSMWGFELRTCAECSRKRPLVAFYWMNELHNSCVFCPEATAHRCRSCSTYEGPELNTTITLCDECRCCTYDMVHEDGVQCRCRRCCATTGIVRDCRCSTSLRPTLRHVERIQFIHADAPKIGKRNRYKRAAGVEIEIAGFNTPTKGTLHEVYKACERWDAAIGTDGSIGTDSGVEIRTSPAGGYALVQQLRDICTALKTAGAYVNSNCGLHVHVDVRDIVKLIRQPNANSLTYSESAKREAQARVRQLVIYERIIAAVGASQGQLVNMVDPRRRGGHYCKSLPHHCDWHLAQSLDRYHLLNTQSIKRHHTLEFRLHEGTVNRRIITAWTLLCVAMIEAAVSATAAPKELAKMISTNPAHWLESIAPTRDAKRYVGWRQRKLAKAA